VSGGPPPKKRLGVLVDGTPLPEEQAHALWDRFSTWMEEHRGDLAGFAAQEGFLSVHPGVDGDRPVLRASKSAAQRPYAPVRGGDDQRGDASGGSPDRQVGSSSPDRRRGNPRDLTRKPRK
jgi:hypothetical protein